MEQCVELEGQEALMLDLMVANPSCSDALALINSMVSGGTAPYTYKWDNNSNSSNLNNLLAGQYCLTVTDANMCENTLCAEVVIPTEISIQVAETHPSCFGEQNGAIDLTIAGGTGDYNFSWNTDDMTEDLDNITTGTYCVTVTDENDCFARTCIDINAPEQLMVDTELNHISCNGLMDGAINLTVSGGTFGYTFMWSTGATTEDIALLAAGNYCVTVLDGKDCSFEQCFDINEPNLLTLEATVTNPACFGEGSGMIDISVMGGTMPYTYVWENDADVEDRDGLFEGNYCVTITDANGCETNLCEKLTAPDLISILGVGTAPNCANGNDGSIELIVSGGDAPYTYMWNNGQSIANPTGLATGTYCVTVTDSKGCSQDACTFILPQGGLEIELLWQDATCAGNDGSLEVNVISGGGSYTYSWNIPGVNSDSVNDLPAGLYTVTVTDGNGCIATQSAAIGEPGPLDCFDLVNVGDFVWLDINMDGIQDPDEPGVEGVDVNLIDIGDDGLANTPDDTIFATTMTDSNGNYLFTDVPPGKYIIEFVPTSLPTGTQFTEDNEGMDDTMDSDANFFSGQTDIFMVMDGMPDDLTFDAGIVGSCMNVITGGEICCDQQICGAGANPEPIVSITPASGGSGAMEYLWMMSTTGTTFSITNPDWIPIIDSNSESYDPMAVYQTTYYIRCARRQGCNTFTGESNIVKVEVLELPNAEIASIPDNVCQDEPISISAAFAGSGATYIWDLGATASPATYTGLNVPAVSWSSLGIKTITLTVEKDGCTSPTVSETIDVLNCTNEGEQNRFLSFSVQEIQDDKIALHWTTNPMLNNHLFAVEYSTNGDDYDHLDVLEGGNLNAPKSYSYEVFEPREGHNYYRIKHLNTNGQVELTESKYILWNKKQEDGFQVYPNPALNHLNIEILKEIESSCSARLVNTVGQTVASIQLLSKEKNHQLDISDLPSGAYYLLIEQKGKRPILKKVFKTRD